MFIFEPVKQFGAYGLIGILLLSVSGLKMSFHSCGGELRSIGIYAKAEACEHAKAAQAKATEQGSCCGESAKHCKRKKTTEEPKKEKCCDDNQISLEILDLELVELLAFDWTSIKIYNPAQKIEIPSFESTATENLPIEPRFKPPSQPPNLLVLHQVFLI